MFRPPMDFVDCCGLCHSCYCRTLHCRGRHIQRCTPLCCSTVRSSVSCRRESVAGFSVCRTNIPGLLCVFYDVILLLFNCYMENLSAVDTSRHQVMAPLLHAANTNTSSDSMCLCILCALQLSILLLLLLLLNSD